MPSEAPVEIAVGLDDIPAALALSDEARWNQVAADWALFIAHGQVFGFKADGRLIASAAILPFGGGFGWISMVLVTAEWRRKGLASRLLNRCIAALEAQNCAALLDATPEGALVYRQLGFTTECTMARWRGQGGERDGAVPGLPALDSIAGLDLAAFGGDRRFLLADFMARPGTRVLTRGTSFLIVRTGRKATQIGPLVGEGEEARRLLIEALDSLSGPIILDLLAAGSSLEDLLRERGFEPFRSFERMVLGRSGLPGNPQALLLAAGPEFG